jgi:hypothetical protein
MLIAVMTLPAIAFVNGVKLPTNKPTSNPGVSDVIMLLVAFANRTLQLI